MPSAQQVSEVLKRKFTPGQLLDVANAIDLIIAAVDEVATTHRPNPALTANGEDKQK